MIIAFAEATIKEDSWPPKATACLRGLFSETIARMLIPRYSLRTTLLGVTLCAVLFLIVGYAYRGQAWAVVIAVAVVSVFVALVVHACFYLLVSALGRLVGAKIAPARTSQGGLQSSVDDQIPLAPDQLAENH